MTLPLKTIIETGEDVEAKGEQYLAISTALVAIAIREGGKIELSDDDIEAAEGKNLQVEFSRSRGKSFITVSALSNEETIDKL